MKKIGIVGAGIIGKTHARAIEACDKFTLAAVADIVRERAEELAAPYGAAVFEDYHKMAEECALDVVVINLPHYLHCEASCYFLEKGIGVLVEKPMAMNTEECDRMIAAAEMSGAALVVGHVQQYSKAHEYLKETIKNERLGKLLRVFETRNRDYFSNRPLWFLKKNQSGGGIVMNYGAHSLDKLLYLTDSTIEGVSAVCTNRVNEHDIEEGAQILLRLSSGVSAVLSYTGSHVPTQYETMFWFEKGVVKVNNSTDLYELVDGEWKKIIEDDGRMHYRPIEELAKVLDGKPSMATSAARGREIVKALEMIYNSAL